jgi:hypothetical protein
MAMNVARRPRPPLRNLMVSDASGLPRESRGAIQEVWREDLRLAPNLAPGSAGTVATSVDKLLTRAKETFHPTCHGQCRRRESTIDNLSTQHMPTPAKR